MNPEKALIQQDGLTSTDFGPTDDIYGLCRAMDSLPFEIDEDDPLVMTDGRHSDTCYSDARGDIVLNPNPAGHIAYHGPHGKARIIRFRNLHFIDCIIIGGFLILALVL